MKIQIRIIEKVFKTETIDTEDFSIDSNVLAIAEFINSMKENPNNFLLEPDVETDVESVSFSELPSSTES